MSGFLYWHFSKRLYNLNNLILIITFWGRCFYYVLFTDREIDERFSNLVKVVQLCGRARIQTLQSVFRAHALWFCLETLNTPVFYLEGLNFALVLTHIKWNHYDMAEVSDVLLLCLGREKPIYASVWKTNRPTHIKEANSRKYLVKGIKNIYTHIQIDNLCVTQLRNWLGATSWCCVETNVCLEKFLTIEKKTFV